MKTGIYYTPAAALSHDGCGGFLKDKAMKILSLSICLIIALAVFVGLGMALTGCDEFKEHVETANAETPNNSSLFSDGYAKYVVIDSCEYYQIEFRGAEYMPHYNLVHKGNCKNCRKFYTELHGATP